MPICCLRLLQVVATILSGSASVGLPSCSCASHLSNLGKSKYSKRSPALLLSSSRRLAPVGGNTVPRSTVRQPVRARVLTVTKDSLEGIGGPSPISKRNKQAVQERRETKRNQTTQFRAGIGTGGGGGLTDGDVPAVFGVLPGREKEGKGSNGSRGSHRRRWVH